MPRHTKHSVCYLCSGSKRAAQIMKHAQQRTAEQIQGSPIRGETIEVYSDVFEMTVPVDKRIVQFVIDRVRQGRWLNPLDRTIFDLLLSGV